MPTALRRWWWLGGTLLLSLVAIGYGTGLGPLLNPAVPFFGDLGGHVVPILELREALARGHVHGWSYSWFGGFPLFYFYFPLPALLILMIAAAIGLAPAIILIVLAGPLLIPIATASLVRASGGSRTGSFLAGAGAAYFLLVRSLGISGGSLESALVGEFSYAVAMALSLFYLATLPRLLRARTGTAFVLPVILLAATALSHVLPTAMAVVGSLAFVRDRRDLSWLIGTWGVAFLVSAWWSFPFLGYAGEMSSLQWSIPGRQVGTWLLEGVPLFILSGFALAWSGSGELDRSTYRLAAIYIVVGLIPFALPGTSIFPGRLLPYSFWAAHVLAAVVAWQGLRSIRSRRRVLPSGVVLIGLGALIGLGVFREPPREAAHLTLEGTRPAVDREDWNRFVTTLQEQPVGAVILAANYGPEEEDKPWSAMLSQFGGRHLERLEGYRFIGGLWQESSRVAPFRTVAHAHLEGEWNFFVAPFEGVLNPETGVQQARVLGARYILLAGSSGGTAERRALVGTRELARDSLWTLYEIIDAAVALEPGPLVAVDPGDFESAAWNWFDSGGDAPLPVVRAGPELEGISKPRIVALETDVQLLPGEIRLGNVTPGRPLLLRLSYFPNWSLATRGSGPFRAAPNHMLVVPETDAVRLVWRPGWIEKAGVMASGLGLALVVACGVIGRRKLGTSAR